MKHFSSPLQLFFIVLVTLSSCKTASVSYSAKYKDASERYINETPILQSPMLVDLDIKDSKVSGSFVGDSVSVEYAKNSALINALTKASADVLIEPIYEVEVNNFSVKASVVGFPGNYKNFRKAEATDTILNKFYSSNPYSNSVVFKKESPVSLEKYDIQNCSEKYRVGKILTITGSTFLGVGVGGLATAIIAAGSGEISNDDAVPAYIAGGALTLIGVVTLPIGVTLKKEGKACLGKSNAFSASTIDLKPLTNFATNQHGFSLRMKF